MADLTGRNIAYRGFRLPADLPGGTAHGVRAAGHGIVLDAPPERIDDTDPHTGVTGRYDRGSWTSPPVAAGFPVREVVPSWTATTPEGCWLRVELRGWADDQPTTGWYDLARWAADDRTIQPTTLPGQEDQTARVRDDTLRVVEPDRVTGWQVRVSLLRPVGSPESPVLHTVGAVATGDPVRPVPAAHSVPGSGSAAAYGRVLDVPRYSQRVHLGHYPQWGGGGENWCSPTCTSMVLAHWGAGPAPERYAWVDHTDPRPVVDHAARHCFDHSFAGTGNWPFNTAYAGRYGLEAFVTRLRSLAEAERFIAAGVPLIVSAEFRAGQVPGLDYDTKGHLMVLVGFTTGGDPVLNDPNGADDGQVRRTVPREPFEAAWQSGSGGVTYVIRPASVPLPPAPAQANW